MEQLTFDFDDIFNEPTEKKETPKPAKERHTTRKKSAGASAVTVSVSTIIFGTCPRITDGVVQGMELYVLLQNGESGQAVPTTTYGHTDNSLTEAALRALEEVKVQPSSDMFATNCICHQQDGTACITHPFYGVMRTDQCQAHRQKNPQMWFPMQQILNGSIELTDTDREAIQQALTRIVEDLLLTPISFLMIPEVFSMVQLRETYDALLRYRYPDLIQDPGNFSREFRRMKRAEFVTEVGMARVDPANPHRPAHLYKFDADRYWALHQKNRRIHIFDFRV